ncbi:hypothetical protein LCGC14_2635670 [marine sediment metagenome]|uniref:Homing endonuclease LAGLIDADG domain-containing protein n=1 Tax=marine sediment metagenome TaxID=412755 RepID=A0A0F9CRB8_9ZZZZ
MVKRTTRAWAAGIVDGEGWIGLEKKKGRKRKLPVLEVANTNKDILDELHKNFGGNIYLCKRPSRPNANTCWLWRLRGKKCVLFLKEIKYWLIGKKNKANEIIKYI